ncbi:MAG TPA: DUF5674 family protein [Candidatus Paceibacterota bacterium]
MRIEIIKDTVSTEEAKEMGKEFYDDMVKGACDIAKGIIALGGEYHIDAAKVLIEAGSKGDEIWGFNIVFGKPKEERIEYTALINIRPTKGNKDMYIQDESVRNKIKEIVNSKVV